MSSPSNDIHANCSSENGRHCGQKNESIHSNFTIVNFQTESGFGKLSKVIFKMECIEEVPLVILSGRTL